MTVTARRTLAATGAALLVGAAMAVLAVLGQDGGATPPLRGPSLPALSDAPLPRVSGEVAVLRSGAVPCVSVVDVASGESRDLRCERDLLGPPRWTAPGRLEVHRQDQADTEVLVLDPADGRVRARRLVDGFGHDPPDRRRNVAGDGRRLVVGSDEAATWLDVVTASGGTRRVLEAPAEPWTGFTRAAWSPDQRLALVEGAGTVYVVDVGSGEGRTLAAGARDAVWRPVVRHPRSSGATGADVR